MPKPKDKDWLNGYENKTPYICCLQETHFRPRDTYRLKVRVWKKIFHANGNQNKAGIAILISDKIDFKIKTIIRDTLETNYKRHVIRDELERHYIVIK